MRVQLLGKNDSLSSAVDSEVVMAFTPREWMEFCSQQLVSGLTSNDALRRVTKNPDLIGSYAEASVREFVRRFVAPLKLSTGSIVYEGNAGAKIPQLDGIIWHPSPLPPILEAGEFALVPRSAGIAYLEIKRSNYTGVGKKLETSLSYEDELVPTWKQVEPVGEKAIRRALGVVCLYTRGAADKPLEDLIQRNRVAVVLSRDSEAEEFRPHFQGIFLLVNFLLLVREQTKVTSTFFSVSSPSCQEPHVPPKEGLFITS